MKSILATLLALAVSLSLLGCESSEKQGAVGDDISDWVGKNVEVQFRRDALGAAADIPISPETGEINGAATATYGKLVKVDDTSVVILRNNHYKWIPRAVILYVEVSP